MGSKVEFNTKKFLVAVLVTSLWINASEIFRYFVFVIPAIQDYWSGTGRVVAQMNTSTFLVWGLWDTLLTVILVFVVWLFIQVFGSGLKSVLISSTVVWLAVFVMFWVAAANMGLSSWNILFIAFPLSWIEMAVGGWIVSKLLERPLYSGNS